jgi:hypothetical protein
MAKAYANSANSLTWKGVWCSGATAILSIAALLTHTWIVDIFGTLTSFAAIWFFVVAKVRRIKEDKQSSAA